MSPINHHLSKEVWKSNFRQYGPMEKQRWEESGGRREEERRSEKRKNEKKEDAGARKGRKVAIHCVSLKICGSGGSRSRLAKATPRVRNTFGSWDVEKVHAVVARCTFASEKAKSTSRSEHFWKLRCGKSARCGGKHVSKSKCTRHTMLGPLLEVEMWKKYEKVHTVAARSTFPSQNAQGTPGSEHFWKLTCRKSARCCGVAHISKFKSGNN